MSFPLFQRPGSIVFLDDDPDYLDMLAMVMPRRWPVRLYLRPAHCIHELRREPPLWEIDAWNQQSIIDEWRQGKSLIPQILSYWGRSATRFEFTRVLVVDYSMPGMDGLQVLDELAEWHGARMLLTGQADEQVAVKAFNRGLIEQFVPKHLPDIGKRLVGVVDALMAQPHARHSQIWRATLKPEQSALLREPAVQEALATFAADHWTEYVTLGDPFGILGLDEAGQASWLQLETREGLPALAEVAEVAGLPSHALENIRSGQKLVALELRQALGWTDAPTLEPVVAMGPGLIAALFDVAADHLPAPITSHREWLAALPPRHVQE